MALVALAACVGGPPRPAFDAARALSLIGRPGRAAEAAAPETTTRRPATEDTTAKGLRVAPPPVPRGAIEGRLVFPSAAPGSRPSRTVVWLEGPAELPSRPLPLRVPLRRAPDFVVVPVGHGVCFDNDDAICHAVFSSSPGNAFETGVLEPGASYTLSFDHPGLVRVYCSLHSGKQTSILVTPTSRFAVADEAGRFVIEDVPPGDRVLGTWGEDVEPARIDVAVRAGASARIEIPVGPIPARPR